MKTDPAYLGAHALLEAYRGHTLSPVEVIDAMAARIERYEPVLNAFQTFDLDFARDAARASEARWMRKSPMGSLDGIPTTIKDTALTKGWPTLHGSRLVDPAGPWDEDAPCTARLREAGAQQVLTASPHRTVWIEENTPPHEPELAGLLERITPGSLDLVLVEGFRHVEYPKIELHRAATGKPLLYPEDRSIIAIATDEPVDTTLPCLDINQPQAIAAFILETMTTKPTGTQT